MWQLLYLHIRLLPIYPHSASIDFICLLPIATSTHPLITHSLFGVVVDGSFIVYERKTVSLGHTHIDLTCLVIFSEMYSWCTTRLVMSGGAVTVWLKTAAHSCKDRRTPKWTISTDSNCSYLFIFITFNTERKKEKRKDYSICSLGSPAVFTRVSCSFQAYRAVQRCADPEIF